VVLREIIQYTHYIHTAVIHRVITFIHIRNNITPTNLYNFEGRIVTVLNYHHAMKTYWGSGGIIPRVLDLGTRWRWVVSFTPLPVYLPGKELLLSLDRRLGGPQSRSGNDGERKIPSPRRDSNPDHPIIQPVASYYNDWPIPALTLMVLYMKSCH
jgi:hypothetical protein